MADAYYMKGKGKPKGKGKGKSFNVVDMNAMWKGKGKSKNVPSRPAVNAYTAETQSFYGLELREPLEAHSTAATNMKPNLGLLDCGATASAGPETSVQKLISCACPGSWSCHDHCEIHAALFSFWEWLLGASKLQGLNHIKGFWF